MDHPREVVVKEGDSLWILGEQLNVDWVELKSHNKLNEDVIHVGEVLKVPRISRPISSSRPPSQLPSKPNTRVLRDKTKPVVVQPGDTAWDIAVSYGLSLEELEAVNSVISDIIYPGDVLLLPEHAVKHHPAFLSLKIVKAKIRGVAPNAHFFDVFPPEKDAAAMVGRQSPEGPPNPTHIRFVLVSADVDEYRAKHRSLLDAMRRIETSFIMPAPVGDGGLSIGPLQISNDYHTDAWWLATSPVKYHHCEAVDYSERTVINYWLRYCPWALEFDDLETLARIHNGGPCWFRHCKTAVYWKKVRSAMRQFGYYRGFPEMDPRLYAERLSVNGVFPLIQHQMPFRLPFIDVEGSHEEIDDSFMVVKNPKFRRANRSRRGELHV